MELWQLATFFKDDDSTELSPSSNIIRRRYEARKAGLEEPEFEDPTRVNPMFVSLLGAAPGQDPSKALASDPGTIN